MGDCYEVAGRMVLEDRMPGLLLCHGFPICRKPGKHFGKRMGHAWCELGDVVFDFSNGNKAIIQKEIYYDAGRIEEHKVKRYTVEEAEKKALETGNWGEWREQTELNLYYTTTKIK